MEHPPKPLSQILMSIYHPDVETDDESSSNDVGVNCIRLTSSTHLSVVKCVPSPPAEKDDWRRTATFTCSPRLKIRVVR